MCTHNMYHTVLWHELLQTVNQSMVTLTVNNYPPTQTKFCHWYTVKYRKKIESLLGPVVFYIVTISGNSISHIQRVPSSLPAIIKSSLGEKVKQRTASYRLFDDCKMVNGCSLFALMSHREMSPEWSPAARTRYAESVVKRRNQISASF